MIDDLSLTIVVTTLKFIGDIAANIATGFRWLMIIQMLHSLSMLLSVMILMKETRMFCRIL